jgi:predicted ferric reductase
MIMKQLEFTNKIYDSHNGVTKIRKLKHGDVIIRVWGAIEYKGEGLFIAGGAGVTPFLQYFGS